MTYDVTRIRASIPALADEVAYFDGPGGTQTPGVVAAAIASALTSPLSNRARVTGAEINADDITLAARRAGADLVNGDPGGIVFGRSMTDITFDIARTLAMFGGFTEGLQLFASFAMLMNFPRFNKMKGMGQIVSWSVRDESLHCEGITKLFHTFVAERDCLTKAVKEDIIDCCQKTVRLEDAFIDLAFEQGPVPGMSAKEIKRYIRYIADWRLGQLGFQPIYMIDEHPLPWLAPMLNGVEHANFFEQRATEYSKAATRGNWNEVWDGFDKRQKAKVGVGAAVANEDAEGGDMFSRAGVAAE